MTKLWARLYLWWHGWCYHNGCSICGWETAEIQDKHLRRAVEILRGKQG